MMQLRTVDKFATESVQSSNPFPSLTQGDQEASSIHFLLTIWKKLQTSNPSYGEGRGWGGVSRSIIHFLLILMTQL
jgi:hypothetical protein